MRQEEKIAIQELLMGVSHAYFVKIYHQLKQIGIHPGQLPIIKLLDFHDGLSQKEIAGKLFLSAPTVTMSIRRMEKANMVSRRQDEKDQRISRIYLTEEGRASAAKIAALQEENEKMLRRGFSEAEIYLFKRFCEQIKENIKELERGYKLDV